ncbi:MAG: outer membrane protein assembly factor BamA [Gammaproteobacteria bacterium]|nr:outer membrane protein assembly factor BamA [Gammaproteobacteria bacterium]
MRFVNYFSTFLSYLCGLFLLVSVAHAEFSPFVIDDIEFEGLQRITVGTVLSYLPLKTGERLDIERTQDAIRALYQTGFFSDVRLTQRGRVLTINVIERPSVARVDIVGNDEIEDELLLDGLKSIGLSDGQVFDPSILERVEVELRRQYFARGMYSVTISSDVEELDLNRRAVEIIVDEGPIAKIRNVNIVGNKIFTEKKLLKQFQLGDPAWYAFLSQRDQYSRQKLSGDLEVLRSYYLDRGYIDFNITSTQVSISPNRKDIFVVINIVEGGKFTISETDVAGDLVVERDELLPLITLEPGDIFSRQITTESSSQLSERLGNEGYAFANVNAVPDIDRESNTVKVTFVIDPGRRAYVRRINVFGNAKTEDEVLRREMRQIEGSAMSTEKINRSRIRLQRLGFFEEVNVETVPVAGVDDEVDVNFSVTELPSGSLLAGLGFSQSQGLLLNFSISQNNFLGSGKRVTAAVNTSDINTLYSFGYLNPYYTIDGVSRGFNISFRDTDTDADNNIARFIADVSNANVVYGFPLSENSRWNLSFGYEAISVDSTAETPPSFLAFLNDNGSDFDTIQLSTSWTYDTRDRALLATRGTMQRFLVEIGGGDLNYYKLSSRTELLRPLTKNLGLLLQTEIALGDGFGSTTELPFFENYFAGGVNSVRGYEANSLGPRENGDALGGALEFTGSVQLILPLPFVENSNSLRISGFFDFGNVYGTLSDFEASELRYSAGLAMLWLSPLGPLTFSLGKALNDEEGDQTEVFQFALGTFF